MQVLIDSNDSLDHALAVVGSLYGVQVTVADSAQGSAEAPTAGDGGRSGGGAAVPHVSRARRSNAARREAGGGRRRRTPGAGKANLGAVRAWARDNGYRVSDRGRVPQAVLDAYTASTTSS